MLNIFGVIGAELTGTELAASVHAVVELEELALRRWLAGDPSGFLELSADDVVYFDPFTSTRINGKRSLAAYYEPIVGKIHAGRYEIIDPLVQEIGTTAVLTYNFVSYGGNENCLKWNCTEVFRFDGALWKIIQTHWSFSAKS